MRCPALSIIDLILLHWRTGTSWKSWDISHTKHELLCISHLCRSDRKKSRSSGVCVSAWTMQFMKHVLPKFIKPLKPESHDKDKEKLLLLLKPNIFKKNLVYPLIARSASKTQREVTTKDKRGREKRRDWAENSRIIFFLAAAVEQHSCSAVNDIKHTHIHTHTLISLCPWGISELNAGTLLWD